MTRLAPHAVAFTVLLAAFAAWAGVVRVHADERDGSPPAESVPEVTPAPASNRFT